MHSSSGLFAIHDDVLSIELEEGVYSRDAVSERLTGLRIGAIFTSRVRPGLLRVQFKLKTQNLEPVLETLEEVAGEFLNSLLDHQLRRDIETGLVRFASYS